MAHLETFACLTCGFEQAIDLSDLSGEWDEAADRAHVRFDGAHRANWLTEASGQMYSPAELREELGYFPDDEEF